MSQPSSEEAATEAPEQTELLRDASATPDSTSESKTAAEDSTDESKSAASPVAQAQPRRVVMQQPLISYQGVDMRCVSPCDAFPFAFLSDVLAQLCSELICARVLVR